MAKTNTKATKTEAPALDAPQAPDLAPLEKEITGYLNSAVDSAGKERGSYLDTAVAIRDFVEENGGRESIAYSDIRILVSKILASAKGIEEKDLDIPADKLKVMKDQQKVDSIKYVKERTSEVCSIAYNKDEKVDEKIGKKLADGEDRWVELRKLARKPQSNPAGKSKNLITKDNLADKLRELITRAANDMKTTAEDVCDMISTDFDETGALATVRAQIEAESAGDTK